MKYWAERNAKAQATLTDKNIKQVERQLAKYYNKAMETVIQDFVSVYEKMMYQSTVGAPITTADLYRLDRYWEMQAQLEAELTKLGNKKLASMASKFKKEFFDIYAVASIPSGEAYSTISQEMVEQMISQIWCADGKSWSNRVWTNIGRLKTTLNDELINCVLTGKRPTELKQKLIHEFEVSYYRADAIVRTEMAHIQTEAAKKRYEDYGIEQVEILADEDERRCPDCGKLHGKRYYLHEAIPVPAHTNCRCCVIPVID